jgi:integrase/recombinase XerD
MELVWATDDLVISGHSYPGFPILLWDSMEACVQVNHFFRHYLLRGSIGSKRSWVCIGRALYDFFSFLQAHTLDWRDVDRGEAKSLMAAYRDYCLDTCQLALNTTRQRLTYVCLFYKFAHEKGWVKRLPFGYEERYVKREASFMVHLNAYGGKAMTRDVMPKNHRIQPKFLNKLGIESLLTATENPHHRIMIRLALHTGMRREELATFPLSCVFDPAKRVSAERNFRVVLDPFDGSGIATKGRKPRGIYISRKFMAELYRYVSMVRGERASLSEVPQNTLLLNQRGRRYSADGKSLNRIVSELGRRAGIKVNTHMLRHTYATHTLISLQRNPENGIDPLVYLQRQLGHSSIQTTMIYLHLVNEMADEAVLAYDDELNALVETA